MSSVRGLDLGGEGLKKPNSEESDGAKEFQEQKLSECDSAGKSSRASANIHCY